MPFKIYAIILAILHLVLCMCCEQAGVTNSMLGRRISLHLKGSEKSRAFHSWLSLNQVFVFIRDGTSAKAQVYDLVTLRIFSPDFYENMKQRKWPK